MHATSDPLSGPAANRRAEANRANAQKSTGPRSSAGRQRSSANSTRHAMLAKTATLLARPNHELQSLLARYAADFRPASVHEETLVQEIAVAAWRMKHITRIETALLAARMEETYDHALNAGKPPVFPFPVADVYGQVHEPEPEEAEPQLADAPDDVRDLVAGAAWGADPAAFALILRYQTQARRDYYRALTELERVRTGQAGYLPEEPSPAMARPIEPEPKTAVDETKPTAPPPRTAAAAAANQTNPTVAAPAPRPEVKDAVEPVSSGANGENSVGSDGNSGAMRRK